jgi:hypothetical protein
MARAAVVRKPHNRNSDISSVRYLIHHVFLPPEVPQEDDFAPGLDDVLAELVLKSLREFSGLQDCKIAVDITSSMVEKFRAIHHESGVIVEARLKNALAQSAKNGKFHIPASRRVANIRKFRYHDFTRQGPERGHARPQRCRWCVL